MTKKPAIQKSIDPEVEAFVEDEKAEKSKRPTRRVANQIRGQRLRQVRKLKGANEDEARDALIDAGLTGEDLTDMMKVWRVYRQS